MLELEDNDGLDTPDADYCLDNEGFREFFYVACLDLDLDLWEEL